MAQAARSVVARNIAESDKIIPLTRVRRKALPPPAEPAPLFPSPTTTEDSSADLAVEPTRAFIPIWDLDEPAPVATSGGVIAPRAFRRAPPDQKTRIAIAGPELTILHDPDGRPATSFRVLRYRLDAETGCQVVAVTAADRGQGASTTSINLALALAEGGRQKVALVDLDLRNGGATRMVGLGAARGLTELLLQRRSSGLGALPMYPVHGTLSVLAAGTPPAHCAEMLGSVELAEVIDELRSTFRYVVLDVPAVLEYSDATLVHALADRFVLCVRAGSDGDRARRATLRIPRGKVLGAVLVDAPR